MRISTNLVAAHAPPARAFISIRGSGPGAWRARARGPETGPLLDASSRGRRGDTYSRVSRWRPPRMGSKSGTKTGPEIESIFWEFCVPKKITPFRTKTGALGGFKIGSSGRALVGPADVARTGASMQREPQANWNNKNASSRCAARATIRAQRTVAFSFLQ